MGRLKRALSFFADPVLWFVLVGFTSAVLVTHYLKPLSKPEAEILDEISGPIDSNLNRVHRAMQGHEDKPLPREIGEAEVKIISQPEPKRP